MDCCIARAAPRVELLPEAVTPATGWGRSTSDDDWSWPLEVSEERLPPVRSSPRRRTSSFRGSEKSFALLPSVGTWLQPLLRPSKASKAEAREPKAVPTPLPTPALRHVPLPEPIREPMEQFQGQVKHGDLWPVWLPCEITIFWDRLLVRLVEDKRDEESFEVWLSPALVAAVKDFNVVISDKDQEVILRGSDAKFNVCLLKAVRDGIRRLDEQIASRKMSFVHLNVYDLFNWHVGLLNNISWSLWGAGAFHVGLQIYGVEYAFGGVECGIDGSGITKCEPCSCPKHSFRESLCLGVTALSKEDVDDLLRELAPEWSVQEYETLGPNCITFCQCLSQRLGVRAVPRWVDSMVRSLKERQHVEVEDGTRGICPDGHECQLQMQALLASLVEVLSCEVCGEVIRAQVPHWHCRECEIEICEGCAGHIWDF